jgi:TolB protein
MTRHLFPVRTFVAGAMAIVLGLAVVGCDRAPKSTDTPIAFLAQAEGRWQLWWIPAAGAAPAQVTRLSQDVARLSWFPEGQDVLANLQDGRLMRVSVRNGASEPLTFPFAGVLDAVIGPDGQRIAFSTTLADSNDQNDIWIYDLSNGQQRKLTSMPGLQHEPAWSADGKSIYFLSGKGQQTHDIWRVDVATGSTEQLTVNALYHFDLAVRDDGAVAYSGNQGGHYDLWLLPSTGKAERLTHDAALDARPSWSPDGKSIVFESTREDEVPNLWRIDVGSKQVQRMTQIPGGARMPVLAPIGGGR